MRGKSRCVTARVSARAREREWGEKRAKRHREGRERWGRENEETILFLPNLEMWPSKKAGEMDLMKPTPASNI